MDKKKIVVILSSLIVALVIFLVVYLLFIKKDNGEEIPVNSTQLEEKVIIFFDTDGGNSIEKKEVNKNTSIKMPTPTKENYIFKGWYIDDDLIDDDYIFTIDVTLKAHWEKEEKFYTVTFDSKGGSKVSSMKVSCDKTLMLPNNPTRDGYTFVTWLDKNGRSILNDANLACEDITLYAEWQKKEEEKKTYTVTFDSKGGTNVDKIVVDCNKTLSLPKNPTRDGYTFVAWVDKNGKSILDGAKLACEDISLYAEWK